MNAITAPLSLHSLLARLEASETIAVVEHEFNEAAEAPWISLEVGQLDATVTLDLQDSRVLIMTADNQALYVKRISADWDQSVFEFLNVLASAVESKAVTA
ncbi:hypothetical protein [Pseudorhodoferax soli]|uniref:Uncharacterized protein n=1 Tax=Pseudorhodoferax soli TaxID=545864 RepID=A0A368XSS8_9BURK|nr:hypothetical protein [Pseudorhodoferax soli]RCW70108.1 hypothetical protein DES41_10544 [Pseudorhodoferax soli]